MSESQTILLKDTFNDLDGVPLTSHTLDVDVVGGGWLLSNFGRRSPSFLIQNNQLKVSGDHGISEVFIDAGESDVVFQFYWTLGGKDSYLAVTTRYLNRKNRNYIQLRGPKQDIRLVSVVRGEIYHFPAIWYPWKEGETYHIKIKVLVDEYRVYVDKILQYVMVTDSNLNHTSYGFLVGRLFSDQIISNLQIADSVINRGVAPDISIKTCEEFGELSVKRSTTKRLGVRR